MGGIVSMFGGSKPKSQPTKTVEEPVVNKQEAPGPIPGENTRRFQGSQKSNLVSGRSGAPTRSGVNIPGR